MGELFLRDYLQANYYAINAVYKQNEAIIDFLKENNRLSKLNATSQEAKYPPNFLELQRFEA